MVKKISHFKAANCVHGLRPFFYYLSRLFGLIPFSINYDQNGQVRVSRLDGLWFMASLITYLGFRNTTIPQESNTASCILILGDNLFLLAEVGFGTIFLAIDMSKSIKTSWYTENVQHVWYRGKPFYSISAILFCYSN